MASWIWIGKQNIYNTHSSLHQAHQDGLYSTHPFTPISAYQHSVESSSWDTSARKTIDADTTDDEAKFFVFFFSTTSTRFLGVPGGKPNLLLALFEHVVLWVGLGVAQHVVSSLETPFSLSRPEGRSSHCCSSRNIAFIRPDRAGCHLTSLSLIFSTTSTAL